MNKRSSDMLSNIYKARKRRCVLPQTVAKTEIPDNDDFEELAMPNDTEAGLLFLKEKFLQSSLKEQVPAIMFKHQLYSVIHSRTKADLEVEQLRKKGRLRVFKLGCKSNDVCIVFKDDYINHVEKCTKGSPHEEIVKRYLKSVIDTCEDVSIGRKGMEQFGFKDSDVTALVNSGVLTVRDIGSWWFSIPGAGIFMKNFTRGRKAVLQMVRRAKYKEILQNSLEQRKMPKGGQLSMIYHIHDIIGADLVESVSTTSGPLLRFVGE